MLQFILKMMVIIIKTTPGFSMGRAGFKQPVYRSVRRVPVPDNKIIKIYTKQITVN